MNAKIKIALYILALMSGLSIVLATMGIFIPDLLPWYDHSDSFKNVSDVGYWIWHAIILLDSVYIVFLVIGAKEKQPEIPWLLVYSILVVDILGENLIVLMSLHAGELLVPGLVLSIITTVKWMGAGYGGYLFFKKK